MKLSNDLEELIRHQIIDTHTAERIQQYYALQNEKQPNRMVLLFGVLGAVLTGLGILLMVAHNWEHLSKFLKTAIALGLLLTGQIICLYVLLKKRDSRVWNEAASAFLCLALASCVSLIAQIYHLSGPFDEYIFYWCLFTIPLVYLFSSSATAVICLFGCTLYMMENSLGRIDVAYKLLIYLLLLTLLMPHYIKSWKVPDHALLPVLHWSIPLSLLFTPALIAKDYGDLTFVSYFSMLSLFVMIGSLPALKGQGLLKNGFLMLGLGGIVLLLWILSFDGFWNSLLRNADKLMNGLGHAEFLYALALTALALIFYFLRKNALPWNAWSGFQLGFALFIFIFFIGTQSSVATLLINVFGFILGAAVTREGLVKHHIGTLNFGLILLAGLIICRFFDSELSYVLRGMLFVAIGIGLFIVNYRMLKKETRHEH